MLTVATEAHHPPCKSFAEDNVAMVGIEPDLWTALGKKLGVTVKPESVDFAALIPGVQAGRYDAALECMSNSPDREKEVTFVDFGHAVLVATH